MINLLTIALGYGVYKLVNYPEVREQIKASYAEAKAKFDAELKKQKEAK